eukprot:gene30567-12627_t
MRKLLAMPRRYYSAGQAGGISASPSSSAADLWQPGDGAFFERAYAQLQTGDPEADKVAGADHDAIADELVFRLGRGLAAWSKSNLPISESEIATVDGLRCLFQRTWLLPTVENQLFLHPFGNAMMISLHSDEGLFSELSEVFAETNSENPSRENLVPEHVHMSQVLAMLPGMSAE